MPGWSMFCKWHLCHNELGTRTCGALPDPQAVLSTCTSCGHCLGMPRNISVCFAVFIHFLHYCTINFDSWGGKTLCKLDVEKFGSCQYYSSQPSIAQQVKLMMFSVPKILSPCVSYIIQTPQSRTSASCSICHVACWWAQRGTLDEQVWFEV
jgi:hypothetical protein